MKYEYMTASFDPRIKFQDWLNQMGEQGWRFHSIIETRTITTMNPQPLIVAGLFVFERLVDSANVVIEGIDRRQLKESIDRYLQDTLDDYGIR